MESRHKILLLDDDPDVLATYKEIFLQLPSQPEIHTATSGARAMALLNSEPYRLLICDLKMPRMDGLQVLSIVRRRFPELRTIVLTAVQDEEFRSRAYALGVDLFWLKPDAQQNLRMFLECIESLLGRESEAGFRGIQSKSLMDIIQMECLSQTSTVLRITKGALVGKIWLQGGELVDAEAEGARGEAAFRRIVDWKSGTFENLPAEPEHERTITKPVNALLLETAQAMDEAAHAADGDSAEETGHRKTVWKLAALTREGAEFVVSIPAEGESEGWGTQAAEQFAGWVRRATEISSRLSEKLATGPLSDMEGHSMDRCLVVLPQANKTFLVAWPPAPVPAGLVEQSKQLVASWDS